MRLRWLAILLLALSQSSTALAADVVKWTARLEPSDARAGEGAQIVVTAVVDPEYHIYSMKPIENGPQPTTFTLVPTKALLPGGEVVQPTPVNKFDPNFEKEVEMYAGAVAFGLPVRIPAGVSGLQKAAVKVRFMACTERVCMPPKTIEVPVSFNVAPGPPRPARTTPVTGVPRQPDRPGRKQAPTSESVGRGAPAPTIAATPKGREASDLTTETGSGSGGVTRSGVGGAAGSSANTVARPGNEAAEAPLPGRASPVHITARLVPVDARAGESAQVVVTAEVEPGYHIYSLTPADSTQETTVELIPSRTARAEGPAVQPPARTFAANTSPPVPVFEGTVSFGLPVRLATGLSGMQSVAVKVRYMACTEQHCLPPKTVEVPMTFTVSPGEARADRQQPLTSPPSQSDPGAAAGATADPNSNSLPIRNNSSPDGSDFDRRVRDAQAGGLIPFLWLALSMGFLALLTPCVFPMVPLTVSFFAKQEGQSRREGVFQALAYCFGIMGTFTGLGLLMSALFGATGITRFATNPFVNLGMAALFIVLAINLFGVFEISVPSWMLEKAQSRSRSGRYAGPILMGLAFTLTSFTCTVPFVGTLLVATAQGSTLWPVLGMLAFSAAFASPFFLLALFPQWLARLPKSGPWLVSIKAFMGFLELAAALKFLSNAELVWQLQILTRPVFLSIWSTIAFAAALYLLGWFRLPHDAGATRYGPVRRIVGLVMVGGGVLCLAAVGGRSVGELDAFLPPADYGAQGGVSTHAGKIEWIKDYDAAVSRAKVERKPLFINFTGFT